MFYQHQPLVYWTSDRGLWRAAGMPSLFPIPARGFCRCQTWGTKGSGQIRHLHTRHQGVISCKGDRWCRAVFLQKHWRHKSLDQVSAHQGSSDLCSKQLTTWVCGHNTVCWAMCDRIGGKYRPNLTGLITVTICCVLWCWQRCWSSQMSSRRGGCWDARCLYPAISLVPWTTRITPLIRIFLSNKSRHLSKVEEKVLWKTLGKKVSFTLIKTLLSHKIGTLLTTFHNLLVYIHPKGFAMCLNVARVR